MAFSLRPGDVTDTFESLGRLHRWLRERLGADHLAITATRTRADHQLSGGYYVVTATAPARRIRPIDTALLVDVAREMANKLLDWTGEPTHAGGDTIRFERRDDKQNIDASFEMRSSGLSELIRRIAPEPADTEHGATLALLDVMMPIAQMAETYSGPTLARVLKRRRRVDWYVGLTPAAITPVGSAPWLKLTFPGRQPGGRATLARPACPSTGYAASGLRSRRRRDSTQGLVELVVRDLLVESGYFDVAEAVDDAVRAVTNALRKQDLPASDSHTG